MVALSIDPEVIAIFIGINRCDTKSKKAFFLGNQPTFEVVPAILEDGEYFISRYTSTRKVDHSVLADYFVKAEVVGRFSHWGVYIHFVTS